MVTYCRIARYPDKDGVPHLIDTRNVMKAAFQFWASKTEFQFTEKIAHGAELIASTDIPIQFMSLHHNDAQSFDGAGS